MILENAAACNSEFERRPTLSGTTPSPSVIVIGGGMAGIAAARALHDASFQVAYDEIGLMRYIGGVWSCF